MVTKSKRPFLILLMLLPLVSLVACSHPEVEVKPPVRLPKHFSNQGTAPVAAKWWTAFNDDRLNALIETAMAKNMSLLSMWDRLKQAQAVVRKAGAGARPKLDVSAQASRNVNKTAGKSSSFVTDLSIGAVASYEIDLWGRIASQREAAQLDALATENDLHAAAITLSAEIAGTWFQLIEQQEQLKLLDSQIVTNEDYLKVVTKQFTLGLASVTDVLQQRQLVEQTKGERIRVESTARTLLNKLAVLVGEPPTDFAANIPADIPALPPLPRLGIPAEWVRQRPDISSAEARVYAADRRLAVAIADRFPRLSLTVSAQTTAQEIQAMFGSWFAGLAANIAAPILDAGERKAEVDRNKAVVSQILHDYGQTVLDGMQEVEDALVQEAKQREYLASLQRQLEMSASAVEQTRDNYTKGASDFTRYLTTRLSHERLQRTVLQAERELVQYRIDLYRAIGGGWDMVPPERQLLKVSGDEAKKLPTSHSEGK